LNFYQKAERKFKFKKRFEESLTFFDESLKLNPYDTKVWYTKGLNLEALDRFAEAIKCYQEILSLNPYNIKAIENLYKLKTSMGDILMICENCGEILIKDSKICNVCGSKDIHNYAEKKEVMDEILKKIRIQ
jgi:tetratricopeptide (TPR) repeat protein